jgi:hypothetical protein
LLQLFVGFCFGHAMSKACHYAMNEIKMGASMKKVSLKNAHVIIQKIITWNKKFGKGKHECEKACHEVDL